MRVRTALKLSQDAFGSALFGSPGDSGVSQAYVSHWETGNRPIAQISDFDGLILHLSHPRERSFAERKAAEFSPLACLPGTAGVMIRLFSPDISDDEWVDDFERLIWPSSKEPYTDSRLLGLMKSGAGDLFGLKLPPTEAIDHDIQIHGEEYVRNLARHLVNSKTVESDSWRDVCNQARIFTVDLFEEIVRIANHQDQGTPFIELSLEVAADDGLEANLHRVFGPEWRTTDSEAFAFGLDFAAVLLDNLYHDDSDKRFDRLAFAHGALEEWKSIRIGQRQLANAELHDHLGRVRANFMELAIGDFKKRNKKRRGRPRKRPDHG